MQPEMTRLRSLSGSLISLELVIQPNPDCVNVISEFSAVAVAVQIGVGTEIGIEIFEFSCPVRCPLIQRPQPGSLVTNTWKKPTFTLHLIHLTQIAFSSYLGEPP